MDAVVLERLTLLRNEIAYLKQEATQLSSFQAYCGNVRLKKAVERSLQIAVEIGSLPQRSPAPIV